MAPRARTSQNIFMELRKICQHPYLVAPELENGALAENEKHRLLMQSSGKMAFLKILLPKLKERGHRVLLFSQFKIALDWIQDFLQGEGYSFLRLDGDIQQAQRQKSIDAFNVPGSEHFIFLLTTRAGGVGINLATADTVIVYDPDFNPHQDLQAIARSHRYGQNKKVLVFKLMTKDSVEEQIVYNGKKKMVLDHLVVQNLGKDNEEEDVSSMLLAGAKALYETNADGTSASDITYTAKQVEEMIDKVEKQAEEEAVLYQQKWDKDDAMTEDERLAAMTNRGSETMNFAFAKIWEMDKGELGEVDDPGMEERLEDEMEDNWMSVFENAERERVRKEAEEVYNKKERRKRIDYGFDDTPRKKKDKSKTGKSKEMSREGSSIQQYPSSDGEFQIGTAEISADESTDLEVIHEGNGDLALALGTSSLHKGLMRKKKTELSKMERRALRKHLQDEMIKKAAEAQALEPANSEGGPSTVSPPAPSLEKTIEEAFFTDLMNRRDDLNKDENRALNRHLKEKIRATRPIQPQPRKSKSKSKSQSKSASPTKQTEAGPSNPNPNTAWPNMTEPILVTNGQYSEVVPLTGSHSERLAAWAQKALEKRAEVAGRAALRTQLEQGMQEARQAQGQSTHLPDAQAPPPLQATEPDQDRELPVRMHREALQDVEDVERNMERDANAMQASRNAIPSVPPPIPSASTWAQRLPIPNPNLNQPAQSSSSMSKAPVLVQMARTAGNRGEIANAQETIKWLWHCLQEFGLKKETKSWARMTLPEIPANERRAIYSNLARIVDGHLKESGHAEYFMDIRQKTSLETLFTEGLSGTAPAQPGVAPKMPIGVGRLIGPQLRPSNGQSSNMAGPSRPASGNGNGQASVPTVPRLDASTIARPAVPLVTPQQRAAMAKSASQPDIAPVITQPRPPPIPNTSLVQLNDANTRPIDMSCLFCKQSNHHVFACAERARRPLDSLIKQAGAYKEHLAANGPGTRTDADNEKISREMRELARLIRLHELINSSQTQLQQQSMNPSDSMAGSSTAPYNASTALHTNPPTFGIPLPARFQQRASGSGPSNGNGRGTSGATRDDAIAIDDDDDDQTVAVFTPAIPPAPAPLLPQAAPFTIQETRAAPAPPVHSSLPDQPQAASAEVGGPPSTACYMCRKVCGLDLRLCAENNGGRKGLKDRIRKLNADGNGAGDAITALYDIYQAWPREETPRKRVKREEV